MLFVQYIAMRDISRLETRLLLAFDALIEERSVTRAAQRLGLTQQGLSGTLQRLRALFSDPLFVREARGVSPTPYATALAPRIKAALAGLENILDQQEFDPSTRQGTINIAASDYVMSAIIAPLFHNFRSLFPHVRLAVQELNPSTLGEQLRSGRIDLALTIPTFAPKNFYTHKLYRERYIGAVRADHPLIKTGFDIDAFCECEHLLISPNKGDFKGTTDEALAKISRVRRVGVVIPSFSVAGTMLEQTDLISVLPVRLLDNMNQRIHVFEPPVKIEGFDVITVWPERVHVDPLQQRFRQLCHDSVHAFTSKNRPREKGAATGASAKRNNHSSDKAAANNSG